MSRPESINIDFQSQRIAGMRYPAPRPNGAKVLLNHGFGVTRTGIGRAFVDLARGLTNSGCTVFAFDRLGHGESDGRFLDVSVPDELDQLSAMLDHVLADGNGPVHLVGHSLGGMESACLAARRPGDLASLTLWAAAAVFVDDVRSGQIQGKSLEMLRDTGVFDFKGQALGSRFVETAEAFDPFAELGAFTGKVFVHQGEADEVVPFEYAQKYADIWSENAVLYRYPDADHGWNRLPDRALLLQRTQADIAGLADTGTEH